LVNGTSYDVEVAVAKAEAVSAHPEGTSKGQPLVTQLPGLVLRIEKQVGSHVKVGETVVVIESMKMDNAIVSSVNGTIAAIYVKQGDQVQADQELALIR
jgi:biotin carboxyl carrier protein